MKGFSIQAFWTHWCMRTLFFLAAGNTWWFGPSQESYFYLLTDPVNYLERLALLWVGVLSMGYERGELSTDLLLIFIGAKEMPSIGFSIRARCVHGGPTVSNGGTGHLPMALSCF